MIDNEALAEKLLSMSPEEILLKLIECRKVSDSERLAAVFKLAYREVCEMRLEEAEAIALKVAS